jgi:hypothetical protein
MKEPILKNPPRQVHALEEDMDKREDVETLIEHIVTENKYGDMSSDEEAPPSNNGMAVFEEIANGGSW